MKINKNTLSTEVMDDFHAAFPFLQLRFYKKAHDHFHGSPKGEELQHATSIGSLNPSFNETNLIWDENMTVDALETFFEEQLGLHIQIFRKAGDQWLQTSITDHWTLQKQNENGQEKDKFATKS